MRDSVCVVLCAVVILASIAMIGIPHRASGTSVKGHIYSDETWDYHGSPYYVEGNVIVHEGATLRILADVEVKFNGYYSLFIEGTLIIGVNTTDSPILFTSNKSSPAIGDWRAIQFNSTSDDANSTIVNAIIEYADFGIKVQEASPHYFWYDTIRNNTYGIHSTYGTPWVLNCTIENSVKDGVWIEGLDPRDRDPPHMPWKDTDIVPVYIEDTTLRENQENGVFAGNSSVNVSKSSIIGNDFSGIVLWSSNGSLVQNNVSSNGGGSWTKWKRSGIAIVDIPDIEPFPIVSQNTVDANTNTGIYLRNATATIDHNDISHNTIYGVRFEGVTDPECNATGIVITENTISYEQYGIFSERMASTVLENNIHNLTVHGIQLTQYSLATINQNEIWNITHHGIFLGTSVADIVLNNVSFCDDNGVRVVSDSYGHVEKNNIFNNSYGVYVTNANTTVKGNNVVNNTHGIVHIPYAGHPYVSHQNITNNYVTSEVSNSEGISLHGTNFTVANNTVVWHKGSYGKGVYVTGHGILEGSVRDNRIENNTNGILMACTQGESGCISLEVINNTITNSSLGAGFYMGITPDFKGNNIKDNILGANNYYTSATVDCKENWWGENDNSGPLDDSTLPPDYNPNGKGDRVSDYIYYRPWLSGPAF